MYAWNAARWAGSSGRVSRKTTTSYFARKFCVEIVPVGCGVETEVVFRRHFRKPSLGLAYEADVRPILFGGVERNHSKVWLATTGGRATIDERRNAQCFEESHVDEFTHVHALFASSSCAYRLGQEKYLSHAGGTTMASSKQRDAARRNIKKAAQAAKKER